MLQYTDQWTDFKHSDQLISDPWDDANTNMHCVNAFQESHSFQQLLEFQEFEVFFVSFFWTLEVEVISLSF